MEDVAGPASRVGVLRPVVNAASTRSTPSRRLNDGLDRAIWQIDTATSGGRHGLVLGVVAGYGRVLIGTEGWRAHFGTILALFAGRTVTNHTREMGIAAAAYGVPLYRELDPMVSEWGPDRTEVDSLIA